MKTMESIYVGQKKFRPALTSSSFYQPPLPHSRMATLRPQSEYGISGMPWNGYSRGSSGSGSAEWPPWSGAGSRIGTARPRKGRYCSLFLAGGALLALAVVLAVAGLALYMGAFRNDTPDTNIAFEGRLKFRRGVGVGSTTGAPSAQRLSAALKQIYATSSIGVALNSADVLAVNEDKLVAFFRLHLDRRKIPNSVDNLEKTIRNVIIENSILKNSPLRQMNVDPATISIRRDVDHHSESHSGSQQSDNSLPVLPQNAKEKIIETRMGVIRKPAVQSNLTLHKFKSQTSTEEPEINFDDLPVIQGSYQATKPARNVTKSTIRTTTVKPSLSTRRSTTIKITTTKAPVTKTTSITNQKSTIMTTLRVRNKTESSTQKSHVNVDLKTKLDTPDYLPKLDSLFVVPSYVDQEPWRPIRPGDIYSTENQTSFEIEERLGETELIDEVPLIEGIAHIEEIPSQIFTNVQEPLEKYNYTETPPEPVYTSFNDPALSSTNKGSQSLDLNYPKPHPIPVNKLSDEVVKTKDAGEVSFNSFFENSPLNNSESIKYTPPKDTMSTVAINVRPLVEEDNVELIGGVIIKKHNHTNNTNKGLVELSNTSEELSNINASYEPSLYSPPSKWEFVNGSMPELSNSKKPPNKTFNETLQAVITENKDPPNLNKYTHSTTVRIETTSRREEIKKSHPSYIAHGSSEPLDLKAQEMLLKELMVQQKSHSTSIPTLLPVKSNSGIGRPLRPRPKLPNSQADNGHDRSFSSMNTFPLLNQVKSFIQNLRSDQIDNGTEIETTTFKTTSIKTEVVTSVSKDEKIRSLIREQPKRIDISEKFRLPKTQSSDEEVNQTISHSNFLEPGPTSTTEAIHLADKVETLVNNTKNTTESPNIHIKLRVESTVSSILDNNDTVSDDQLLDIINNISLRNNSNKDEISVDKLKHLANIAMITDSHNNTFFSHDNASDETIISTKAVSSNYKVNNAGFKILTKTFNKIPGNYKDDEKKINKHIEETPYQVFYDNAHHKMDSEDCGSRNLTIKCSNGQCLPETARCNRLLDCPNGEDEDGCTCADYLRSQFLIRKICDGVPDCWDFSDENNCEWCSPDQYICTNSRQCIDKDKICDGKKDCPLGDDEKQCVTVAMTQDDAKSYPYSKEGYIMVQKHGQWGKLCVQNFEKVVARSHSSLQIADLGRAVCKTMTYIDYENVDKVIEDEPNKEQSYYSLHYTSKLDSGRGGLGFRKSSCSKGQVAKVVCSQLQCGARPQAASQQARIVGGGNAGAGSWPWQAALYKEGDFQCGATLISDRWLISAGHCFYHAQEDFWVARLGALRRGTTFPSPYEQLQPISSIILHPGYIDSGFINDIALLKTSGKVAFSDFVRPICLPPYETDLEDGRRCTVIGWGQLFEVGRIFPDTLQEVELPVISTSECRKRTIFLPLYRITDDMFCAGFDRGGRDACLGDSGGPLMCQEQDNQWYLHGVTSNGYGCARANRPGVYTKVANYVNWIQTTMQLYDDRSYDHPTNNFNQRSKNSSYSDLDVSESRSLHRHVDKCRGHRCPLGECLPPTRVCNGFMECSDGSDEKDCK